MSTEGKPVCGPARAPQNAGRETVNRASFFHSPSKLCQRLLEHTTSATGSRR